MNQDTPAREIKPKDLESNSEAIADLLREIRRRKRPIHSAIDIRYGLGGWARQVFDYFPNVSSYEGYEQDPETAKQAWKCKLIQLHVARFEPGIKQECDLLLAEFNTLTVLKRDLLDESLKAIRPKALIFTDVACSKLHLNYRSYAIEVPDLDEYWKQFTVKGFRFVRFSKRHHAASTGLFFRA